MPRIVVDPERLRALAGELQRAAGDLAAVRGRLGALGRLDWEARQKTGVEGQVNDARGRASALAGQAEALARYLNGKAEAFAQADRQGATDLGGVVDANPFPIPPVSLPTLDQVFDLLKASLSTIALFVTSLGLDAVKVFAGAADFFLRKLPDAEAAFRRWEEYNRQDNWDRATSLQYQEEARKALDELGVAGLKDAMGLLVDKLPKTDAVEKALGKLYDAVGAVDEWIGALGGRRQ